MEKESGNNKEKMKEYLELRYNPNTVNQYLKAFERYEYKLKSQKDVDDYMRMVFEKNNNPYYIGFLKAYLDCFNMPFEIVKSKRKNPNIKKEYKFLTKDEIDLMIKKLKPKYSLFVRLYFETGLRLNELLNSKRKDINLNNKSIKGIGKGNKPFLVYFSDTSKKLLESYLESNERDCPFWIGDYSNQGRMFYYYLKKYCDEIGIENVHPHRLRHSLGYYLRANKGWDLQQIKVKLRHAKLETTDIYAPSTEEEVRKKMEEEVFD